MTGKSSVSYHEKKLSAVLQKQSRQLLLCRHRALLAPPAERTPLTPAFPDHLALPSLRHITAPVPVPSFLHLKIR